MQAITITEKNIRQIYGRIRKFFYNRHSTGFDEWHNFDCGFKKHISPNLLIEGKKTRVVNHYPAPEEIEFVDANGGRIIIRLTEMDGDMLECGDRIAFYGNRIIHQKKWIWSDMNYIYTTYQVAQMDKNTQEQIKMHAKLEAMMIEEY